MSPVVVLVGVPGAGKSTVGAALADELGVSFADTDQLIEASEGRSVADIFVESGEDYFRDVEMKTVREALNDADGVLSLGGGAVMRTHTQAALAGQPVIWLRVSMDTAARRVGLNVARPVLLGNVRGKLMAMMKERAPVYEAVASGGIVDNDSDDPQTAVDEIRRLLDVRQGVHE